MLRLKNNVLIVIIVLATTIIAAVFLNIENSVFFVLAISPYIFWIIYNCFSKKYYLLLCFLGLVFEELAAIVIKLSFISRKENSWRVQYNSDNLVNAALRMQFTSLLIISLVCVFFVIGDIRKIEESNLDNSKTGIQYYFFIVFAIVVSYYFLNYAINSGLRDYKYRNSFFTMALSVLRICIILSAVLSFYGKKENRIINSALMVISFSAGIILSLKGYRYILVECFALIFFIVLSKIKNISFKTIIMAVAIGIVFYIGLIYVKSLFTNKDFVSLVFNHERAQFYTICAVVKNLSESRIHSYLSTLQNILPKAFTGSKDPNTGQMLMRYISYSTYKEGGYTMGAYYLTEAYANYHVYGVAIVSIVIPLALYLLENHIRKHITLFGISIYYCILSQIPTIIYYGSSNYIKLITYFVIASFLVTKIDVKVRSENLMAKM